MAVSNYPPLKTPVSQTQWRYTATGGETTLSGNSQNGQPLSYTINQEELYLNGVMLVRNVDYTASTGSTITGLLPLSAGDFVQITTFSNSPIATLPANAITGLITNSQLSNPSVTIGSSSVSLGSAMTTITGTTIDGNVNEIRLKRGTTAARPATATIGNLYFNTELDTLQEYTSTGWRAVYTAGPTVLNIAPTTAAVTGTLITINGLNFASGATVSFIGTDNTVRAATTTTFVNTTQITATTPALPVVYEPYSVKVTNLDNQYFTFSAALDAGAVPSWTTGGGNISTVKEFSNIGTSVVATDVDGQSLTYTGSSLPAWLTITSGGSITGLAPSVTGDTTFAFDVVASDGVNTTTRTFWVVIQDTPTDAQINYVTLLIHGDALNNKVNNVFVDSSTNAFSPTLTGSPYQGSFNPYMKNWSVYINGSTDWLTSSSTAINNFGTGDFSVEAWIYPALMTEAYGTIGFATTTGGFLLNLTGSIGSLPSGIAINAYGTGPSGWQVQSYAFASKWYHVAYTRTGTTGRLFVNGTQIATGSDSVSYTGTSCVIGSIGGGQRYAGHISNVRIVKGNSVYTTAFTPSTIPLTASVAGGTVSALMLQGPNAKDSATSPATYVASGSPRFTRFSPFSPAIVNPTTASGAYTAGTQGGSGYFDGSSWVQFGTTAANFMSTGSSSGITTTLQAWVYPTAFSTPGGSAWLFPSVYSKGAVYINWGVRNGALRLYWYDGGYKNLDSASTNDVPLNQWTHIMTTINGTTITHYINGVQSAQASTFTGVNTGSLNGADSIGYNNASDYWNGYISDFMLSNTVRSVPSLVAPSTSDANTKLNVKFDNAGVFDSSGVTNMKLIGNAKISTSISKFGGSSIYLDGTNSIAATSSKLQELSMGSGDFTIEFQMYPNSISTQTIFSQLTTDNSLDPHIYMTASGLFYFTGGASRITGSALTAGQWYHIAVSRNAGTTRMFVNGTQVGSSYTDSNNYVSPARVMLGQYMTAEGTYATASWANCYIDEFRMTKGYSRYTANFTAPTSAFAEI